MNHVSSQRASRRRQAGLTMVEVMVAVAVGLLLTAGAIQIFVSSKQAYRTTDAMSRVQENGRYALHFLAKDIRSASFWGCAQDTEVNNLVSGGGFDFDGEPIEGSEGASGAPDSITLRKATQNQGMSVSKQMPNVAANLFLTSTDGIGVGDIMIITDCESADVFAVTNVNQGGDNNLVHNSGNISGFPYNNSTQAFSKSYGTSAVAYSASERTYSIGTDADGKPVLQRTINGAAPEILVDNAEDLQIVYGIDTDNDLTVNAYVPADVVPDWSDVLAVRVAVTVRSAEENVAEDNGSSDGRVRKTFTRTLGVRNRLE